MSRLTTDAYYYSVSDNNTKPTVDSTRAQVNGQDLLCYDYIALTTAQLQAAFNATVNSASVDSTAIVSIGSGADVRYRDGVRGKDGTLTYGAEVGKIARLDAKCSNNTETIEMSKNKAGITFTFTGTGTITLNCSSTSSSNDTWFALKDSSDNIVETSTKDTAFTVEASKENCVSYYKISGSTGKEITYTISTPGSYTIYVSNDKPLRTFGITIEETA